MTSAAVLEPAYDVGGDCLDHAINGFDLDVAILDAMGHGLSSSVTSALVMGSYRHDRREGQALATIHKRLDAVIAEEFKGETFVTGQIGRLALQTGHFTWINAGHPPPLLVRDGRVVRALACRPSLPWYRGPLEEQAPSCSSRATPPALYRRGRRRPFLRGGAVRSRPSHRHRRGGGALPAAVQLSSAS